MTEKNSVNKILKLAEDIFDEIIQKCAVNNEVNFDELDIIVDKIHTMKNRMISFQDSQHFTIGEVKRITKKLNKEKGNFADYIG